MSGRRKRRIPLTYTILIVDDTRLIVEGLVLILKKYYRPLAAFGGEQCLDILSRETPDLIILDIMMEPMDGWETLGRIKADPRTRDIPVLMFSAKKITPEEAEAHRITIDDFISKPVNPKKTHRGYRKGAFEEENREGGERCAPCCWDPAEKISEYFALRTTLDVDASLRDTLQKQLDLAHLDAPNRDELRSSIAAIGNRITEQSDLADELSREWGMSRVRYHRTSGASHGRGSRCCNRAGRSARWREHPKRCFAWHHPAGTGKCIRFNRPGRSHGTRS